MLARSFSKIVYYKNPSSYFQLLSHNGRKQCHKNVQYFCQQKQTSNHQKQAEKQRRRKIKQQMERQQIQNMNRSVNRTANSFNSFSAYLHIYKYASLGFIGISAIFLSLIMLNKIMGKSQVWICSKQKQERVLKKQKKLSIISQQYENSKSKYIMNIFLAIFQRVELTNTHNNKINELKKLGVDLDISIVSSQHPFLLNIPSNQIIISHSLFRKLSCSELKQLIVLFKHLFQQRYHIRELKFSQILTFLFPLSIDNQIKLRQIYSRPYSKQQIQLAVLRDQIDSVKLKNIVRKIKQQYMQTYNNQKIPIESIIKRIQPLI